MKFSSISLIAAAIAGSAIAAPGPLCTRALERVNLLGGDPDIYPREWVAVLERDVDGEPIDDLFTRAIPEHQVNHAQVAELLRGAINAHRKAANWALWAHGAKFPVPAAHSGDYWHDLYRQHSQLADGLGTLYADHLNAASLPDKTELHAAVNQHKQFAVEQQRQAARTLQSVCHAAGIAL